jgi:uncharacterized protein YndB with AHSA1/START domain
MGTDSLQLTTTFAASPARLYQAFTDADEHAAFTGAGATFEARVGGAHTAWDGYISGTVLELAPPSRLVLSWRTTEFPKKAPDSRVELRFVKAGRGTRLELAHETIPKGQGPDYEKGWEDYYFAPLRAYLAK